MIIQKEIAISKPIADVWEVMGNQFGEIDKWSSLINKSTVSGEAKLPGVDFSIRSTDTAQGATKQELTAFDPKNYSLSYAAISGTPFFIKSTNVKWSLTKVDDNNTKLSLNMQIETAGLIGMLLSPVAKKKLSKLGDEIVDDLKYYLENGKPHPRKLAALN